MRGTRRYLILFGPPFDKCVLATVYIYNSSGLPSDSSHRKELLGVLVLKEVNERGNQILLFGKVIIVDDLLLWGL